jgi:hypothetical protein
MKGGGPGQPQALKGRKLLNKNSYSTGRIRQIKNRGHNLGTVRVAMTFDVQLY